MVNKSGFALLKEKVPAFGSPWKAVMIFTGWFLLFLACLAFFWWFDGLVWYGALISQTIIALACSWLGYAHMRNAQRYRAKYGSLAYRRFFFHFIVPIFATWYACIFHPLLVGGTALLPLWLALVIAAALFSVRPLTAWHIHRAGFDEVGHGLGIYTVYPEEGTMVSSEIYSYIRHPIYTGGLFAALAFAFARNNPIALACALIFVIPILVEARLEDNEMTRRFGEEHREYMRSTGAILPRVRKTGKFLRFLLIRSRG